MANLESLEEGLGVEEVYYYTPILLDGPCQVQDTC